MKYLKTHEEKCIGCGVCMNVCSRTFFKTEDPEKSCIRIQEASEGQFKITVCNQKCRLCVAECPVVALTVNKFGVPMLDKKICVGCYACVAVCPIDAMRTYPGGPNPFKCVACGACARQCPTQAIEIVDEEI